MRRFLLFISFLFFALSIFGQTSTILMQRCLGDSSNTNLLSVVKTNDGGFITGGWVTANNGDVSGYKGGSKDGWVIKVNELGGIEWQRCIGGSGTDIIHDIIAVADGYIVAGSSSSYDGDISLTHSSAGNVADDAFIAKLSTTGQLEWIRCYGGSENDIFKKLLITADGGFICAGSSESNDGDVSGHHPSSPLQDYNPSTDVWVVKINSTGAIEWQKSLGGGFLDQANDIVATSDGNYIVAGNGIAYQTTDVDTYYGGGDIWLIKISASGDEIWGKAYGGSDDEHDATIVAASDGGFVVAFLTYSNDGICSQNHSAGPGMTDIGMIKIDDNGSLLWSKCYGGSDYEWFGNLGYNDDVRGGFIATADGGYILCGTTSSVDGDAKGLHGEITVQHVYNDIKTYSGGEADIWVVKLNQTGNVQWQKCFGGKYSDIGQSIVQGANANEFAVIGDSFSNDGDISGNKVTPETRGYEGWIAKFKAGNAITGTVFKDNNSNGIQDPGEPMITGAMVTSAKPNFSAGSSTLNGWFFNVTDTGQFVTTAIYSPYYAAVPSSITTPYHSNYYSTDTIHFAMQPIPGNTDLVVNAFTPSFIRLGREMQYKVMLRNPGTVNIGSGVLKLVKDRRLNYQSSIPAVSSVVADTINWNYTNLNAGDTLLFTVSLTVQIPPVANLGDTLTSVFSVLPIVNDQTPSNDTAVTKDVIIGAYDPNDKVEVHGGVIPSSFASSGGYLQYTIRFQNTGNDTAFNVVVKDTLDAQLDWSTVQMVSSSHPVSFSAINGNQLTWTFNDINLVDSNRNEPLSHGYVVYEVKPKHSIVANDVIHNDASIYFDYNLPVATNDASTVVKDNLVALPTKLLRFSGNLQNKSASLLWQITQPDEVDYFDVERSVDGRKFSLAGRVVSSSSEMYSFADAIPVLQSNLIYYRLKVVERDGSFYYSSILVFRIQAGKEQLIVYPNPTSRTAFVSYTSEADGTIKLEVIDVAGKIVLQRTESVNKGQTIIELSEFNKLAQGKYLMRVYGNGSTQSKWLVKQGK